MDETAYVSKPIRSLQKMLRTISNFDTKILPVIPDGQYNEDTKNSVLSFQQYYDLPQTGTVDYNTWDKITDTFYESIIFTGTPAPMIPAFRANQIITKGEINNHMPMIHGMLISISYFYPDMPISSITNIHDEQSASAIKWLQNKSGLEPTGEIDRKTWHYLAHLYRSVVTDGTLNKTY